MDVLARSAGARVPSLPALRVTMTGAGPVKSA
jgi:hypothetical protein